MRKIDERKVMISKDANKNSIFRNLQPLTLASASPRRRRLLSSVGLEFEVFPSGIAEVGSSIEPADVLGRRWAAEKAQSVSFLQPNRWVLGADTIVVYEGKIFGKPESPDEAAAMLRELGGKTHEVITGIALAHHAGGHLRVQSVLTQVRFRALSEEEIMAYVGTGEPLDKAGAYGIQGIGAFLVQSVHGSYTNVVGLPLGETLEWLLELAVIAPVAGRA